MTDRRFPVFALVFMLVLAAAGCRQPDDRTPSSNATVETTPSGSAAAAAPDARPLTVTNAYLVLPAVPGRPGAAYFTIANRSDRPANLIGVAVAGAGQAQMHHTSGGTMAALTSVVIPVHGSVQFRPGDRHVMVFGIPADLRAGETSTVTLTFKGGHSLSAPLAVRAVGSSDGAMSGMAM